METKRRRERSKKKIRKDHIFRLRMTNDEKEMLINMSTMTKKSKSEIVRKALTEYYIFLLREEKIKSVFKNSLYGMSVNDNPKIAEYCNNDIIATEAAFNAIKTDFSEKEKIQA